MRRDTYTYEENTFGSRFVRRLGRFVALLVSVFGIGAGIVVTQRLSDDALGVILGMVLVGLPLLAIVGVLLFILLRRESRRPAPHPPSQHPLGGMVMPPIIMQMPSQPQLPDPGYEPLTHREKQRAWDLIGEEGVRSME